MASTLFAYDRGGALLLGADGAQLLAWSGRDEAPLWQETCEAPLVAVGVSSVEAISVDAAGRVVFWDPDQARRLETIELGAPATAAAVSRVGVVAVALPDAVALAARGQPVRKVGPAGATAVAHGGTRLAIGTADGHVHVIEAATGATVGDAVVGGPVRALAWSTLGHWLVGLDGALLHLAADVGQAFRVLVEVADSTFDLLACSGDGRLVAARTGPAQAWLYDTASGAGLGGITYVERQVTGLEFGPGHWLGIGLDRGDGNKVDTASGAVHRTDTHPGRPHNSWLLENQINLYRVTAATGQAPPDLPDAALPPSAADPPKSGPSAWNLLYLILFAILLILRFSRACH